MDPTKPSVDGEQSGFLRGEIQVPSLIAIILFYLVILVIGIVASFKSKEKQQEVGPTMARIFCFLLIQRYIDFCFIHLTWRRGEADIIDTLLAGRKVGLLVGAFSMTATWVGGGFINGSAEFVYTEGSGLVWTQAPWCFALSIFFNGIFFAAIFRKNNYVTLLDPIQIKYGRVVAALIFIPAASGDIFWSGAILSALGGTLVVIVGLTHEWSVIISASIAIIYTLFGGFYSVALTDVFQLSFIFVGLWLSAGFALVHPAVTPISETMHQIVNASGVVVSDGWLGHFPTDANIGYFIDGALLMIIGGMPWQVYYQRACSQQTPRRAQILSMIATAGCLFLSIPAIIIGAVAKSADWKATNYKGPIPFPEEDYKLALPLVLQYLTPLPVAVIGLGAVSAAVMSSTDSSMLASASMFARNVYGSPSDRELIWVMRAAVLVIGVLACVLAITVNSVYGLFYLCSDLVYVLFFPTLLTVIYIPFVNTGGVIVGFLVGMFFRFTGGEPMLGLGPLIHYPYYEPDTGLQLFPFKTLSMLINLITALTVSAILNAILGSSAQRSEEEQSKMRKELSVHYQYDWDKVSRKRSKRNIAQIVEYFSRNDTSC